MFKVKNKDVTQSLCVATGFLALLSYTVMFSVAWGFYDQGYPNGVPIRNAALISTVPLFFIMILCLTCTLAVCCKDLWTECCPGHDYDRPKALFWLTLLSPLFMVSAGLFAIAGGVYFAVIAATFVPEGDIPDLSEVHLFGAAVSVFGVLTGLCCCCGSIFCCCALRGETLQGELDHLQEHRTKFRKLYVESSL